MSTLLPLYLRRTLSAFLAATALFSPSLVNRAHAVIDNNATEQIWKLKYGVTQTQLEDPVWLNQDTDGDGIKNSAEIASGTNPFNASKTVKVSTVARNTGNGTVELTFSTEPGKFYQIQSTSTLGGAWALEAQSLVGDGTTKMLSAPYVDNKFYRVRVTDTDTDGDGVSDWAERAASLNPAVAQTVPGVNDHDYVNAQIALPNIVSIKATAPFASEDGPTAGMFKVTRTQSLLPITVTYSVGGTATAGVDYDAADLTGAVALPAGTSSANIPVNPLEQAAVEGSESVTATLTTAPPSEPPYTLGTPNAATVIINDSTVPTGTGLLARYYDTASSTYAHAANFGQDGTYVYTRTSTGSPNTGTILIPYTGTPAVAIGNVVRLTFTAGNLNTATYNNLNYTISAVTPGVNFTAAITGTSLPASDAIARTCNFSIQSFPHPPVIERIDPVVNNDWVYGTPHGVTVIPNSPVNNYSTVFEGYLHPTTAGNYQFQLDADDKARVLLDINLNGVFDPGEDILEHGWDGAATPETVGTFKQSAAIALAIPGSPAQRYKIRVEHVETTGDARCRLQWREGSNGYANIPQANVFSHTRALTNYTVTSAVATINTAVAHGLTAGVSTVTLYFTAGTLFTPPANYSGTYTVQSTPTTTSFTINVPGAANQAATTGLMADSTSTTTGWLNQIYTNTTFTAPPGYVNVVGGGATNSNNGIWGSGTPDPVLIGSDTFSIRWTGQVQPQFTEDYTFVVHAEDGSSLWINGQLQEMETAPSTSTGIATYDYSSTNGDAIINYTTGVVKPGSFIVGETVRVDPTSANLTHGNGSTYTFDGVTGILTVNYSNLANITPGGFTVGETIELDPTSGTLSSLSTLPYVITNEPSNSTFTVFVGTGLFDTDNDGTSTINILDTRNAVITKLFATGGTYSYSSTTGNLTVTYSTVTGVAPNGFTAGMAVELDPTSGNLSALTNAAYTILASPAPTATAFTVNVGTSFTTGTGNVNIASSENGVIPASITNAFAINFGTGKYTTGTGNINVEIVNKPLKEWASMGNERYVRIPVIGGTRYDIQLDYYENTGYSRCALYWYSASQPKQIIPTERLYPASVPQAPAAHISPTVATTLVGGLFTHQVAGSNGAIVTISGNPPWLTYSGGVLSGTPPTGAGGDYQILITITNAAGTSTSVLNLHVDEAGGSIVRELWSGIAGTGVASIPVNTTPTSISNLSSLAAPSGVGPDYGARIRGYITAPVTGNYYFWIAANNAAELWISNDDEPVNAFKRASVLTGSATPQTWNGEANQKSPWLALEAGQRYYIEVLHKAGSGTGDNLAIGWAKPGQGTDAPSQVVPGYVLSPYIPPAPGSTPGTLYVATMLAQGGAVTNGVGVATMRLSEDENVAYVSFDIQGFLTPPYNGLTGIMTDWHVHNDAYLSFPSSIMYDPTAPPADSGLQPDGTHKWTIPPTVGTMTKAQVVALIKQGKAYINIHTTAYLNGEIRGNFTLANGSRTFTPPPAPPSWTDDHTTNNGAARFLTQATFGANPADIAALKSMASYEAWIDDQFTKPTSLHLPEVIRTENASAQGGAFSEELSFNAWWWRSVTGADQLRQRIAFALSEIHVVSAQGPLDNNALALSYFYDKLASNAFGNFRTILEDTTLTPAMGRYLDMLRNDKPDQTVGRIPNENYAREIKQLFSIGLYRMWPDGTLMLNSKDSPIDTYTQREIVGFAHVFTGWDYGYDGALRTSLGAAGDWTRQMREVPARHFTGPKRVLNNEVLPGLAKLGTQALDPNAVHTSNNYNDTAYQNLPAQELDAAHDQLFNHPNVGPFICRQLIQRLVTSHPSRDYLYRVVQKFNDNGSGVRGDMKAVIKAILLDFEARSSSEATKSTFGKQREPVMRVAAAGRAFRTDSWTGTYSQSASPSSTSRTITINTVPAGTPHKLVTGNSVFLDFTSGTNAPWIGAYQATVVDADTFTVTAQGWATGTYNIPANSTTCTVTMTNHWLQAGHKVYIDFTSGLADGVAGLDGIVYTLIAATAETGTNGTFSFAITTGTSASARTGNMMLPRFSPGSYTTSASGLPAPNDRRVTMDTNVNHHLSVGDQVQINFYGGNPQPVDMVATVESVIDLNTWTFTGPSAGTNLSPNQGFDQVYQFPLVSQPLTRSGNVGNRPSTYVMNNTTGELQQSPLNSPTVFNFYLPDYKFPGTLASQGMTTPEFQETAETSVIRQANFIERGVYALGNTNGLSSFISGSNALVLDLIPWMQNAVGTVSPGLELGAGTNTGKPWTNDENLSDLIDRLNTLLLAGQLPPAAKAAITTFVQTRANMGAAYNQTTNPYTNIAYNNSGTPSETERRNRIRAIVHFILTSPDFTIQR